MELTEKFDLRSHDIAADKQTALRMVFPEVFTEGGKIDLERLNLALGEMVDVGKERYGMNWPGKADCFKTIQQPSMATLVPAKAESVAWDTTENLIIEGDNLEVLKLLQKSYLGRVKMIYIDPPYNTGNDFIYPDNYAESLETYLRYTGQVDSEGRKYSTNTEADGRFHSKWLNMMYPRLYLARNLLSEDGVIFISIDDCEVTNLRKLCDEVFGEENFVATILWQKKYAVSADDPSIGVMHDYLVAYRKSDAFSRELLPRTEKQLDRYTNPDNDPRGVWSSDNYVSNKSKDERPTLWYPLKHAKTGEEVWPDEHAVWRYSLEKHQTMVAENRLYWGPDQSYKKPRLKRFLNEIQDGVVPSTWWPFSEVGHNDEASKETGELLGRKVFDTPKPVRFLQRILTIGSKKDDIILDFFGGSGTTGQAVLDLNKAESGNRKFILVQLPEPTEQKEFPTIADITKERVRRVIKKLNDEDTGKLPLENGAKPDRGFKVFKLQSSNFKTWNADKPRDEAALAQQLEMHVHHIVQGRTQEDLLFEVLLKSGFSLTTPIETLTLAGQTVFSIAGGAMLICLETTLTPEVIKEMAARNPERVVCLDEGFAGNDQLKTNAVQTMKARGVTKFQTV